MAPPSSTDPAAAASGGRRKRARTQTEDSAHDPQTTMPTLPTRRSQRVKLANTSVADQTKAIPDSPEDAEEEQPKTTNRKASKARAAKPKPVKSEDTLGEAASPSSTSASKEAAKQEKPFQARDNIGFWLMKSEPDVFSYEDLCKHDGPAGWDGVRNHVAKNHLRSMKVGDKAFFYHSNCKEPGIVGLMEITRDASVDETQFDPKAKYYDPKATISNPRWYLVHCSPIRKLGRLISLTELRTHSGDGGGLKDMALFRQTRLSVGPVSAAEFQFILDLEDKPERKDTD